MSSEDKNLSEFSGKIPKLPNAHIGIAVSEWNDAITGSLLEGAKRLLSEAGIANNQITVLSVPGSYELILASQRLAQKSEIDGVIALGCIIQGETRHFDFICQAVATGISDVNLKYDKPVIFGVLTTDNQQQALDRSGGKHGNKGEEAAYTVLRMIDGVLGR
ncbi:MAG: 6,7-dimethyl-8-ribityllumazine synthase [Bacteroidia bacterium]|jgi:6,7-dimethyl-8-ribityllumazine synthase